GAVRPDDELGVVLQIAMVHSKTRGKKEAAEPYFERLRKLEPAHPMMLAFFREWCREKGDPTRLVAILTEAQRGTTDPAERRRVSAELAKLAEDGENAAKAIEQWRALLRQDPSSDTARENLRRLYRQTGAYPALADLLRADLDRPEANDPEAKLAIL